MQIKVKDTKMHNIVLFETSAGERTKDVPVAEAKLVLVECKPEEALLVKPQDHWMLASFAKTSNGYPTQWLKYPANTFFKPVLISETEKIEVGDWVYDTITHELDQVDFIRFDNDVSGEVVLMGGTKHTGFIPINKVLAFPKHFSPKHLQAIVDGKLKDGDKVLVECEEKSHMNQRNAVGKWFQIRLLGYPNPHITLHKVEEKMVPISLLEKAFDAGIDHGIDVERNGIYSKAIAFCEWFEQNVK